MKIHKGDTVKIITGKDRGKKGKVMKVDYKNNSLLVEGLNVFKKHQRPRRQGEKGEIISVVRPLAISKVMLICPKCGVAARIGLRFEGAGENRKKIRYCKKCQGLI